MSTKRIPRTAALAAKPTTGVQAEAGGRAAYEYDAGGKRPPSIAQQEIADVLANILTHGASDDVLEPFLTAVARHFWHWRTDNGGRNLSAENINKLADPQAERWRRELTVTWARAARIGVAKPVPGDLEERIRFAVVEELRDTFETFLHEGTPEEHRLMVNVFIDHHSSDSTGVGIPIARAFSQQLGKVKEYIEVPEYHRSDVEKYLECLEAAELAAMKDEKLWENPEPIRAETEAV